MKLYTRINGQEFELTTTSFSIPCSDTEAELGIGARSLRQAESRPVQTRLQLPSGSRFYFYLKGQTRLMAHKPELNVWVIANTGCFSEHASGNTLEGAIVTWLDIFS